MKKQSNIHPLFEQICDIIRPQIEAQISEIEAAKCKTCNYLNKDGKCWSIKGTANPKSIYCDYVPVEAARIKAEKRKLKTINVEIKQIKTLK